MSNFPILSFNAGRLSPQIDARSDVEKYGAGCRILDNMLPRIYGSAERRPGTKFIASVETPAVKSRLVPFIFSSTIAYMIEFGDLVARVYFNGALIDEIVTTYLEADLPQLQFKQLGDIIWIVHPSYPPRQFSRTDATTFSIDNIVFGRGPFRLRNNLANDNGVTLSYAGAVEPGSTGTLTASSDTFLAGHVGSAWQMIMPRTFVSTGGQLTGTADGVIGLASIGIEGDFTFKTTGTWFGTVRLQRRFGSEPDDSAHYEDYRIFTFNGDGNADLRSTESEQNYAYRIFVAPGEHTSSSIIKADLQQNAPTLDGIVRIVSVESATSATVTVLERIPTVGVTTQQWSEPSWSDARGFPASFTFFEDRAVYAGSTGDPQTMWLSATSSYQDFRETTIDDGSFSLILETGETIRWIEALEALVIGTTGDEWRIRATTFDNVITPTNFSAKRQTSFGSTEIRAIPVNASVLFTDTVKRRIREMTFSDSVQKYVAPDLTALAEDITNGFIATYAHQRNPDSIVWVVLDDGQLLSMSYDRDQDVIAWATHTVGGSGIVESVAVIPATGEDEVYLIVRRTIDGNTVRHIELMQPRDWGSDDEDAFFVDDGITFTSGSPTTTITGLTHLEGETVQVYGDGVVLDEEVVSSGQITASAAISKAQVGLSYTYQLKPMRMDISGQSGTSKGSIKKIAEVAYSFFKTLGAKQGDGTTQRSISFPASPAFFTGDIVAVYDGGYGVEDSVVVSGSDPVPCTVRAIIPRVEKTGR